MLIDSCVLSSAMGAHLREELHHATPTSWTFGSVRASALRQSYTREGFGEAGPFRAMEGKRRRTSGMLFTAGHATLRPSRLSVKGLGVEAAESSAASLVLKVLVKHFLLSKPESSRIFVTFHENHRACKWD